jgi:type II secretory pathway pseudopilin PulG
MQGHRAPVISRPRRNLAGLIRDASGITLIESLMASGVVGIGVIGLALMMGIGQAVVINEGDNRVALFLAQQAIEHCRAQGFGKAAAGTLNEQLDPASATADASNPCATAGTPTTNCTTSTVICYSRTTVVDCVSTSDYSSTATCSGTTLPWRITVTVQSGTFVAATSTVTADQRARPVTLQTVLANR